MSESAVDGLSPAKQALLARLKRGAGVSAAADRPVASSRSEAPLACAQERLWVLQRLQPSVAFNGPIAAEILGRFEPTRIDEALDAIVERHSILRSRFVEEDGVPLQQTRDRTRMRAEVADLRRLSPSGVRAEALRLSREFVTRPFSFSGDDPLLRSLLLPMEPARTLVVVVAPMLVFDAASCRVVMRELHDVYEAGLAGRRASLPALPFQFADYAIWENQRIEDGAYDSSRAYWRQQLAHAPPLLELPLEVARPAYQTFAARRLTIPLTASLASRVDGVARRIRATPFVVLLGALYVLLHRYSAAEDIVVGSWVLRRAPDTADLVGPFVNTICLRVDISGNPTIEELLGRVRKVAFDAYAHDDAPFERVLSDLRVARDLSHNPLFQVNCVYQDASVGFPSSRIRLSPMDARIGSAVGYDLEVVFRRAGAGLSGFIEYKADLFSRPMIATMAEEYARLIEIVVSEPSARVSQLSKPSTRVLGSAPSAPPRRGIITALQAIGRSSPDKVAVVARDGARWSYNRLLALSSRVTSALRAEGLPSGTRIGVFAVDEISRAAAVLGIWGLGGVAVPVDDRDPRDVVEERLSTSGARAVLLDAAQDAPAFELLRIAMVRMPQRPHGEGGADARVRENAGGYVQFTSGTTGSPLAVFVPQAALERQALSIAEQYSLRPGDRVLRFAAIDTDVYFEELVPTLLSGATVVVADLPRLPTAEALLREIEARSVTVVNLPTAYWEQFTREFEVRASRVPSCLRLVVVGGEQPSAASFARFRKLAPKVTLINAYGVTEATITTTIYRIGTDVPPCAVDPVPAGRAIRGASVHVLDRHGGELPVGAIGRVYIGGELLASGYLGQPELTVDRFVADPSSRYPGRRFFKTDDIGRKLPDGSLQLLGRTGVPKVRGYRVDPLHIASRIQSMLECECHVRVTPERVVAYLGALRAPIGPEKIRARLSERLPRHLVPSHLVALERLPRSPRGHVLSSELPELPTMTPVGRRPPVGRTQRLLASAWEQALGIRAISRDDDFFALGGDSLVAIKIATLAHELGLELEPAHVLRYPTVSELASQIDAREGTGTADRSSSAHVEAESAPQARADATVRDRGPIG